MSNMMERKCADCALKALQGGVCPIFNADMSEKGGCPMYTTEIVQCSVCGAVIPVGGTAQYDPEIDRFALLCGNCVEGGNCATCAQPTVCRFEADTSCQEPPYVMVQRQQGNAIIQTQQLNPKRVEATCRQGCPCFWEDGLDTNLFCRRTTGGCGCRNYKLRWRD